MQANQSRRSHPSRQTLALVPVRRTCPVLVLAPAIQSLSHQTQVPALEQASQMLVPRTQEQAQEHQTCPAPVLPEPEAPSMSHAEVPRSCTSSANSQTAEAPAPCTSSESSPPSQALQGFSIVMASTHSTQSNTHNMHRQAREYTSQHLQPIATSSRETKLTHLLIEVDQALPVIRSIASCWLAERCRGGGRRALAKHGALSWLTEDRGRGRGHRCRCSCGSCLAESRRCSKAKAARRG